MSACEMERRLHSFVTNLDALPGLLAHGDQLSGVQHEAVPHWANENFKKIVIELVRLSFTTFSNIVGKFTNLSMIDDSYKNTIILNQ